MCGEGLGLAGEALVGRVGTIGSRIRPSRLSASYQYAPAESTLRQDSGTGCTARRRASSSVVGGWQWTRSQSGISGRQCDIRRWRIPQVNGPLDGQQPRCSSSDSPTGATLETPTRALLSVAVGPARSARRPSPARRWRRGRSHPGEPLVVLAHCLPCDEERTVGHDAHLTLWASAYGTIRRQSPSDLGLSVARPGRHLFDDTSR